MAALELVANGNCVWPAEIQKQLPSESARAPQLFWHGALSRRENEIMALLCADPSLPDKGLAEQLRTGVDSVRSHLTHIFKKFGVHKKADAIRRYLATRTDEKNHDS